MPKTKSRTKLSLGTKEARLEAAQRFTSGDRVRYKLTGSIGKFDSINLGFALPEVWVQFETDTEFKVPISCNPIELELVERLLESPLSSVASVESGGATEAFAQPTLESGEGSDTLLNCWKPGMRVWSDRTVSIKGQPDQVKRMTGVVMGTTSRQIVPDQTSVDPIDTPLVEVQWDEAKFTVLLSPGKLHMESDDQASSDTGALTQQATVVPEIVEELTEEEAADRQRLEIKVERAFYEAGTALSELRDRRLYRGTHRTFEAYCQDRFGFTRRSCDYLIAGSVVIDNLKMRTIRSQISPEQNDSSIELWQVLPTKLEQVKPLTALEPDEQRSVWQQAVEQAGGKVPSGRIVKGIVERLKERAITPPPIPYREGDVVMIRGMGNPDLRKFDGRWAIALVINEYTITVALGGKDIPVKPQFLEPVDPEYWADIKAVHERITRLQLECELDPMDDAGLEALQRRTCFTPRQMILLESMENYYGVV